MKFNICTKICPGCSKKMKAVEIDHPTKSKVVYIEWFCDDCERSFGFSYIQDTEELNNET